MQCKCSLASTDARAHQSSPPSSPLKSHLNSEKRKRTALMKTSTILFRLLMLGALSSACNHHHEDKEWTKEELAELEAKWGFEVRPV